MSDESLKGTSNMSDTNDPSQVSLERDGFDDILKIVAQNVVRNNEIDRLGTALGFTPEDVYRYLAENSMYQYTSVMGTLRMLRDWCKTQTNSGKWSALHSALLHAKFIRLADEIFGEGKTGAPGEPSETNAVLPHSPSSALADEETSTSKARPESSDEFAKVLKQLADDLGDDDAQIDSLGGQLGILQHDIKRAVQANKRSSKVPNIGTLGLLNTWREDVSSESERRELRRALISANMVVLARKYFDKDDDEVDVSEAVERGMVTCNRSRIMVVGPAGVGKTCFICRLTSQGFRPDEPSTIGTINTSVTSGWKIEDRIRDATAESLFRYQEGAKNNKNSDVYPTSSATSGTTVAEQNAMSPLGASAAQPETTGAQSESAGAYPTTEGSESNVRAHKMASGRIHNVKSAANDVTYSIWDFGGQEIYYITHPLFLSWRALYIVVFPLHKQLTEGALRKEKSCNDPLPGLVPRTHRTMRDLIHFWLLSIYIHAVPRPDIEDKSRFEPKILLVGTFRDHEDSSPDKIKEQITYLREIVRGKPYERQVIIDVVEVDNESSTEGEISKIQELIDQQITDADYMKEKLPIKWRLFLDEMNKLDQDTLKLKEAIEITRDIGIDNEDVLGALQFCHEAGYLIFHPGCDLIVIRPKFLNDIVSNIITVNTNMKQEELSEDWTNVKKYGVLSLSLVKAVWEQHGGKEDELDMVITMMIKFDLICEFQDSKSQERQFYVPCLSSSELHAWQNLPSDDKFEFAIEFKHLVPDGYLHRLYVRMTKWAIAEGGTKNPSFHCRDMLFHVDERHGVIMKNNINGAEAHLIKVIISAVSIDGVPEGKVSIDSGRKVITHLKCSLEDLKETWARRISFSFCIPCKTCSQHDKLTLISVDKFLTYKGIAIACQECQAPISVRTVQQIFGDDEGRKDRPYEGDDQDPPAVNKEQQIILEEGRIVITIPAGEPKDRQKIVVETVAVNPTDLALKDNEAVISVGLKFSPPGITFDDPIKITMPHCAVFSKTDEAKIVLYNRGDDGKVRRVSPSSKGTPRCVIRETDLDLYIDHFCFWYVVSLIEGALIGKRLVCTPLIPLSSPRNSQHFVKLHLKDYYSTAKDSIPDFKIADEGQTLIIWWGYGDLLVKYIESGRERTSKKRNEATFHHSVSHRIPFALVSHGTNEKEVLIELNLKQRTELDVMFVFKFDGSPSPTLDDEEVQQTSDCDVSNVPSTSRDDRRAVSRQTTLDAEEVAEESLDELSENIPYTKYDSFCSELLTAKYNRAVTILATYSNDYKKAMRACLQEWKNKTGGSTSKLKRILLDVELGGLDKHVYTETSL